MEYVVDKDGSHLESFLDTETWDEFHNRMSQNCEWGFHMILQGVFEVTCFKIIDVNSEIIKTGLKQWHSPFDTGPLKKVILLGHMGENNYACLHPRNWQQSRGNSKYFEKRLIRHSIFKI